ncbi:uncharacterized protein EMH_0001090 [Eimeria mitis]|uniref:Uncharacterized protein n=1 Tax=Eimeria mitis TaxID=44415 RepID=U6JXV4_9EIME|nr:uncharacterized protein EMH_0001090 [Eimeria mitis]CDJ28328.1 hypothetical protein, conserved [Eimeria mitis]
MESGKDHPKNNPAVVVVPPSGRPPEAPFADPATGAPIQGKAFSQTSPAKPKANPSKFLDPEEIDNVFERQESRLPDLCEEEKKGSTSK